MPDESSKSKLHRLPGPCGPGGDEMKRQELLELMPTLADAWNAGPASPLWETFRKRHTEDVAVYWPGGAPPTRGRHNHGREAADFITTLPDNHLSNRPYTILISSCNHT